MSAQYERAQISLIDQQFAQFMYGLPLEPLVHSPLPKLDQIFNNELNSLNADVYQLQIAYLNTILLSPIPGIVTGIYKNPGEAVKAGEPVIRVENDKVILLVGTLVYPGPIKVGSAVTVSTTLFDTGNPPTTVTGGAVAVRGRREQDDHWDVIVLCSNLDSNNSPIFPLGYHFDYDRQHTMVSIN
jgi:hypothetical protein